MQLDTRLLPELSSFSTMGSTSLGLRARSGRMRQATEQFVVPKSMVVTNFDAVAVGVAAVAIFRCDTTRARPIENYVTVAAARAMRSTFPRIPDPAR